VSRVREGDSSPGGRKGQSKRLLAPTFPPGCELTPISGTATIEQAMDAE